MKKSSNKLIASGLLMIIAISLMVTVSYAWFTMAGSPALSGVQINIGGSNTIKIAADMTKEINGNKIHYPGEFQDFMNIEEISSYDYLNNLEGLVPVSTADGIHWFMPATDGEMELHSDYSLGDYIMDETLSYANISRGAMQENQTGSYVYLDFWVVSPMDNCTLRVSIGSEDEGSYVVTLPEVVKDSSAETGFKLKENAETAACVRVGFLVNTETVIDDEPMKYYSDSEFYWNKHKRLKGIYVEPGNVISNKEDYSFSVYEPNGTKHNNVGVSYVQSIDGLDFISCADGEYVRTLPLGLEGEETVLKNIASKTAVQGTNTWKIAENGETVLSQIFQSSMLGKDLDGFDEEQVAKLFYKGALQNNYAEYVKREAFFEESAIVKLERDVPQRIRMFVWLEGQDVDCVRQASSEYFAIGLELAGSTKD